MSRWYLVVSTDARDRDTRNADWSLSEDFARGTRDSLPDVHLEKRSSLVLIAQHFIIGRILSLYIVYDIVMSLDDEHYEQIQ